MSGHQPPLPLNPALRRLVDERRHRVEDRAADAITGFAGSMRFVYLHIAWFGLWIGLGAERYPYGLLTMIVSLEATFLSTFVMISQNRSDERRQLLADQHWQLVHDEEKQNEMLIRQSNETLKILRQMQRAGDSHPCPFACHLSPPAQGHAKSREAVDFTASKCQQWFLPK